MSLYLPKRKPVAGELYRGHAISETVIKPPRGTEYRDRAAMLRLPAQQPRLLDPRERLMALADSFDKLTGRVEARQTAHTAD